MNANSARRNGRKLFGIASSKIVQHGGCRSRRTSMHNVDHRSTEGFHSGFIICSRHWAPGTLHVVDILDSFAYFSNRIIRTSASAFRQNIRTRVKIVCGEIFNIVIIEKRFVVLGWSARYLSMIELELFPFFQTPVNFKSTSWKTTLTTCATT